MKYLINGNKATINRDGILVDVSIDNIRFTEYLGEGANSIVFIGFDELLERQLAIKIWVSKPSDTRNKYLQALKEAKKIASLKHTNIVDIYGANSHHQNTISLEMELVNGITLREYLKSNQTEIHSLREMWNQLFDAMSYCYKQGIYHGDLHDRNILIIGDSDIKIIDFGTSLFALDENKSKLRESKLLLDLFNKIFGIEYSSLLQNKNLIFGKPEIALHITKSVLLIFEHIDKLKSYADNNSEHWAKSEANGISASIAECPFLDISIIVTKIRERGIAEQYINIILNQCITMLKLALTNNPYEGIAGAFHDKRPINDLIEAVDALLEKVRCLHDSMYQADRINYLVNIAN